MTTPVDQVAAALWARAQSEAAAIRGPAGVSAAAQALTSALSAVGAPSAVIWCEPSGGQVLSQALLSVEVDAVSGPEGAWAGRLGLPGAVTLRGPDGRAALVCAALSPAAADAASLLLSALEGAYRAARPDAVSVALLGYQRQHVVLNETSRLIRGLAHDVRNILNVVGPALEVPAEFDSYGKRLPAEDRLDELVSSLAEARAATARLQHVLDRVSYVTKAGSATLGPLDVTEALLDVEYSLHRAAGPRHSLSLQLDPDLPAVLGDEHYLSHMVVELVENARDASPPGAQIEVRAHALTLRAGELPPHRRLAPGRWVHLEVADRGCGMTPENAERYVRAFESAGKAKGRVGLGLTEAAVVTAGAQGQLLIESAMFSGTTVHVFLPAHELTQGGGLPSLDVQLRVAGLEVVIVALSVSGDEVIFSAMLKAGGFDVRVTPPAGSLAPSTLDALAALRPAAVLVDDPEALRPDALVGQLRARCPELKAVLLGWSADGADGSLSPKMNQATMIAELRRVIAGGGAPGAPASSP
ncbi:MAG: HAMP domain-containing histidine kinase [Deltaproteobacteria bacterium]|nr:HAMP domain-containing histidine kinase [Deltaproteobacteria bacterium]